MQSQVLTTVDLLVVFAFLLPIIFLTIYIFYKAGKKSGSLEAFSQLEKEIPRQREDAIKRSRSVLTGQFHEQLAPILPDFPYNPAEARFLGKPIDFLIFNGMENDTITDVIFLEVKTGQSRLSQREKSLKSAIENKRVHWAEYHPPANSAT